jgi:hypothetical protein
MDSLLYFLKGIFKVDLANFHSRIRGKPLRWTSRAMQNNQVQLSSLMSKEKVTKGSGTDISIWCDECSSVYHSGGYLVGRNK